MISKRCSDLSGGTGDLPGEHILQDQLHSSSQIISACSKIDLGKHLNASECESIWEDSLKVLGSLIQKPRVPEDAWQQCCIEHDMSFPWW